MNKNFFRVQTSELWDGSYSLGFEVVLTEVDERNNLIDEHELWYNFEQESSDFELELVDDIRYDNIESARAFFERQVDFYENEYK